MTRPLPSEGSAQAAVTVPNAVREFATSNLRPLPPEGSALQAFMTDREARIFMPVNEVVRENSQPANRKVISVASPHPAAGNTFEQAPALETGVFDAHAG